MTKLKKLASLLLVVLIVSSATVTPVAAQTSTETCSGTDEAWYLLSTVLTDGVYQLNNDQCDPSTLSDTIESMQDAETNESQVDIYTALLTQDAQISAASATQDNYANDSKTVAWTEAEVAVAHAYQNGSTEAEARQAAREAIEQYYAQQQKNVIGSWNAGAESVAISAEQARQNNISMDTGSILDTSGPFNGSNSDEEAFVYVRDTGDESDSYYYDGTVLNDTANTTYTLTNGNTTEVRVVQVLGHYDETHNLSAADGGAYSVGNNNDIDYETVAVQAPDSSYDEVAVVNATTFNDRLTRLESDSSELKTQVDAYVNSTYDAYQAGQINASDVVSKSTLVTRLGTDASDSGNLWDVVGALSAMGIESPEFNQSGVMTVEYSGVEYTGVVMGNAPNSTWTVNKTYDTSNISSPVFIATTSGTQVDVQGEFTITEIRSINGTEMQSVNTTTFAYRTYTADALDAKLDRLANLSERINERQAMLAPSAGGTGGSGLGDGAVYVIGGLAAAAVIALIARESGN